MKKRLTAVLLAVALVWAAVPVWAQAAEPPQMVMEYVLRYLESQRATTAGDAAARGLGQVVDEVVSHPLGCFTVQHLVVENGVLHVDVAFEPTFEPLQTDNLWDFVSADIHVRTPHITEVPPSVSVTASQGNVLFSIKWVLWEGDESFTELEIYFAGLSVNRSCMTCGMSHEILAEDVGLYVLIPLDESRFLTTAAVWEIGREMPSRDGYITIERVVFNHLGTEIYVSRILEEDDPALEFSISAWSNMDVAFPDDMTGLIERINYMVAQEDFTEDELYAVGELIMMLQELAAQDMYLPVEFRPLVEVRVGGRAIMETGGVSFMNADYFEMHCTMSFAPVLCMDTVEIRLLQADGTYLRVLP